MLFTIKPLKLDTDTSNLTPFSLEHYHGGFINYERIPLPTPGRGIIATTLPTPFHLPPDR